MNTHELFDVMMDEPEVYGYLTAEFSDLPAISVEHVRAWVEQDPYLYPDDDVDYELLTTAIAQYFGQVECTQTIQRLVTYHVNVLGREEIVREETL